MCGNKRKYEQASEQSRYYQSRNPWRMSWLPFAIIAFFVFGPHSWSFVFQPWMWFLLPVSIVLVCSFFAKMHSGFVSNTGMPTQAIPQQPYQNALPETYSEGGQNFPYPLQQVQQVQYEEPQTDYQQLVPPQ